MADDLYECDAVAWAEAQAAALRSQSVAEIDWDNVAEEIGDVGRMIVRACESQVIGILTHFLRIEHSGLGEAAVSRWIAQIGALRVELERDMTPTIDHRMPGRIDKLYGYAVRAIRNEARGRGETVPILPEACPYTWDDVQGRGGDWTPAPRA